MSIYMKVEDILITFEKSVFRVNSKARIIVLAKAKKVQVYKQLT